MDYDARTHKGKDYLEGDPDADQIRFNHAFWDARWDREHDRIRAVVETGPHTIRQVSREFNEAYYHGYTYGLDSPAAVKNSLEAWEAYRDEIAFEDNLELEDAVFGDWE